MGAYPCPVTQVKPLASGAFRASNRLVTRLTVGALPFIFNLFCPVRAFRALFRLILGLTEKSRMRSETVTLR